MRLATEPQRKRDGRRRAGPGNSGPAIAAIVAVAVLAGTAPPLLAGPPATGCWTRDTAPGLFSWEAPPGIACRAAAHAAPQLPPAEMAPGPAHAAATHPPPLTAGAPSITLSGTARIGIAASF